MPPVILPVAIIKPPVPILPMLALPEIFAVPVMFAPVPVTTTIFALPAAVILTLPLATGMFTLLLPLASGPCKLAPYTLPVMFAVPLTFAPVPVITTIFALPAELNVMLPLAVGILKFEFPYVIVPAATVALVSKYNVLFDNHKSFHLFVELPKLYVTLAFGIRFDVTNVVINILLTVIEFIILALPAVMLPVPIITPLPNPKLPTLALPDMFAVPAIFAPVDVTTTTLAVPDALIVTLPLIVGILTLLLPLACGPIKLPPVILPVAIIKPLVPILPMLALPEIFAVPVMFAPVPVTTTIFALPAELILTLPLLVGILTLLLPLAKGPIKFPPVILPVAIIKPPVPMLPILALPDTVKLVSVPTLVILG